MEENLCEILSAGLPEIERRRMADRESELREWKRKYMVKEAWAG